MPRLKVNKTKNGFLQQRNESIKTMTNESVLNKANKKLIDLLENKNELKNLNKKISKISSFNEKMKKENFFKSNKKRDIKKDVKTITKELDKTINIINKISQEKKNLLRHYQDNITIMKNSKHENEKIILALLKKNRINEAKNRQMQKNRNNYFLPLPAFSNMNDVYNYWQNDLNKYILEGRNIKKQKYNKKKSYSK